MSIMKLKDLSVTLLGRTQQHKKEEMGHGGDFFWYWKTCHQHQIYIRDRWHGRCSEKNKKDLLLGEPEKNKQEVQRGKKAHKFPSVVKNIFP